MKRYDYSYYDGEFDGLEESEHGQWVPAKVAQALYDALLYLADETCAMRDDMDNNVAQALRKADKALSLADGEE